RVELTRRFEQAQAGVAHDVVEIDGGRQSLHDAAGNGRRVREVLLDQAVPLIEFLLGDHNFFFLGHRFSSHWISSLGVFHALPMPRRSFQNNKKTYYFSEV